MRAWLEKLGDQIATFLATGDADAPGIAHKLVAQAGMLGYPRLSDACRAYEDAVLAGGDPGPALDAARALAMEVRADAEARGKDPELL
ncbi:MAG TPA: hypothetical protein VI381_05505 [Allosphingosinicella sp.]